MSGVVTGGVREQLEDALTRAVRSLGVDGDLPDLELGRAKAPERGEYASSAGLKLARVLKRAPAEIAARLAETIVVPGVILVPVTVTSIQPLSSDALAVTLPLNTSLSSAY